MYKGVASLDAEEQDALVLKLLKACIATTTSPPVNPRVALAHLLADSSISLSMDGFDALFRVDTTFGMFGMPVPQQDPYLNVVALTSFQPYEDEELFHSDEDVLTVLTPIYRILCVLAIIVMKRVGCEDGGELDLKRILPYKPRTSHATARYASLLEVAASVWLRVCHAYVNPDTRRIDEVYCFNPQQERAHVVWIDLDVALLVPQNALATDIQGHEWIRVMENTLGVNVNVVLVDEATEERLLFSAAGEKDGKKQEKLLAAEECFGINRTRGEGALIFCRRDDDMPPFVDLVAGDADASYFLLITHNGGHYSALYRNVTGTITAYPLYMHQQSPEDAKNGALQHVIPLDNRPERCCVCARSDIPVVANELEADPETNGHRRYCSVKCIGQMVKIDDAKRAREAELAMEEARARRQFPSRLVLAAKEAADQLEGTTYYE